LAAVRGRMKLAAMLAALACVTSTKAWIWVAAVAAVGVIEIVRARSPRPARTVAVAVPALAILIFLQLGFAPASHSVARGSVELLSATGRGSLPTSAIGRLAEVAGTYGLAALPLLAFAVPGAIVAIRRQSAAMWRFLYLPALAYLAVVVSLIASGSFSGSHRYLYPALPAFALLAAAALDRYAAGIRLIAVGATAALSVAFLPVFVSFANDNTGLIAAGRAAASSDGALLTDSPVAAYYSQKPLSQITGSRVLPADPARAVAWMRTHHVSTLVLEDISYYRATAVFPNLTQGQATPPFTRLGEQSRYQVAGGKAVYAYELDAGKTVQPIYADIDAALAPMPRQGKTSPLAKGIALWGKDGQLTGEGMGFGVPIVHYADGWVYPRSGTDADLSMGTGTVWERTFQLDEIGGDAAHGYRFEATPSRGEIVVTYMVDASGLSISVRPVWLTPGYSEVGILNELSAAFDDFAADGQPTLTGSAFGNWVPVTGGWARLRSGPLGVEWSLPSLPGASLHGGRELAPPDFDWAGLDYIFAGPFTGTAYHINVQGAR
ncbi:MAG TPA: hypothetical protein VJQ08_05305, partial [Candidatus Dormibacteraeota bacterium]|nr:hypothetical protein [Candidatus Dormibacteraeota bacterium]